MTIGSTFDTRRIGYYARAIGNPAFDWIYITTPQANLYNATFSEPRGKMLGGTSALNGMVWNRASQKEYDAWEQVCTLELQALAGHRLIHAGSLVPRGGTGTRCSRISRSPRLWLLLINSRSIRSPEPCYHRQRNSTLFMEVRDPYM